MSVSQSRGQYADMRDTVVNDCEEVVITRGRREPVVVVSLAELEALQETVSDTQNREHG